MCNIFKKNKMEIEIRNKGIDEYGIQVELLNVHVELQGRISKQSMSCLMADIAEAVAGTVKTTKESFQFVLLQDQEDAYEMENSNKIYRT